MEIKGTAVKTLPEFVQKNYPDKYNFWLQNLPEKSKIIYTQPIFATTLYNVTDAIVEPTKKIAELFFNNDWKKTAWETGKFSSETSLNGIYKIFIKVSSPLFVLSRSSNVFGAYYNNPDIVKVLDKSNNAATMQIKGFSTEEELVIYRISGWVEKTIEICGFKNVEVKTDIKIENNIINATIICSWK